jgi:2-dehydro-3-deoxygalactonokinase
MGILDKPLSAAIPAPLSLRLGVPTQAVGHWTPDELCLDLLDDQGVSLQAMKGVGWRNASSLSAPLSAILADWDRCHGVLPLTLSGLTVGPTEWGKVDPTFCPVHVNDIASTVIRITDGERPVALVPGLTCFSRTGCPDYLWGEETMLVGAALLYPDLLRGAKAVCIPGPRTRWIMLRNGQVLHFTTSLPGEIYRLLAGDALPDRELTGIQLRVFARGMKEAADHADIDLLHLLPQGQSRSLEGEIAASDIPSFLLGLLVHRDVTTADALLKLGKRSSVVLIADQVQGCLYDKAFEAHGLRTANIDRGRAIAQGLSRISQTA